ncbi:RNA polymerase sigma factor, partial [Flavobacterium sp.]|uniref:RNA polymerase sigma factor n=1 Tax=Flavobacterium sp. TaxID=239 RepID=UPI0025C194DC
TDMKLKPPDPDSYRGREAFFIEKIFLRTVTFNYFVSSHVKFQPLNEKEFNKIVEQTSQRIYRFVYKNLKNDANTKDVVQETYVKLWTNKNNIDQTKILAWLFTCAYRTMIDFIRKQRPEFDINDDYITTDDSISTDTTDMIYVYLDKLSPLFKSVILLRDIEGYNYAEIGTILSLSESQVKVYLFRARQKLKSIIEKNEV